MLIIVLYAVLFLVLWIVLGGLLEAGRSKRSGDAASAVSEAKKTAWASVVLLVIAVVLGIWKHSSPVEWIPACIAGSIAAGYIACCLLIIWQCRRRTSTMEAS